ncbi:InlB B-repeat-containing protein [Nocardioides sp. Bht2]|uniref:InlB B-repeat-containing protein n=1 Tax=Nocardioides sp. Bht2 TaxID=3392297 RepID=UPI0039B4B456
MLSRSAPSRFSRRTRLCLLSTVAVAVGLVGVGPIASPATAATVPGLSGDGSALDPVVIDSAADLDTVAAAVNTDAATYGSLSYRLGADVDYGGATFAGFDTFSGTFDGDGHQIGNVVLANNQGNVGFFRTLQNATVTDLTLRNAVAATTNGDSGAGLIARSANDSVITGNTLLDSTVRLGAGGLVNTQAAGLVGSTGGTSVISDNLLWNVSVTGHKYAAGLVAYPLPGARITRNLMVDTTVVSDTGGSGAFAGLLIAQRGDGSDTSGNVVLRGSAARTGSGVVAVGTSAMTGPAANLVSTATTIKAGSVAGPAATRGTLTPQSEPDLPDLTAPATYQGLAWDLSAPWRWHDSARHPILARASLPSYQISYDLAGGEAAANPVAYTFGDALTLGQPVRGGYDFLGWTGTDLASATREVTLASGTSGDRSYLATWSPVEYPISYDLAGGTTAATNPATYTIESDTFILDVPTRPGYAFAGWIGTGLSEPTLDVAVERGALGARSYTATWSGPVAFPISYDLAGGAEQAANPTAYDLETASFELHAPIRPGYRFAGWLGTDLDAPAKRVEVTQGSTGARTYTATWTALEYAISYQLAGGTVADGNRTDYTVETGAFDLVAPTRTGYTFAGWTGTDLDQPTLQPRVPAGASGDRSYLATWTPITYRVSIDLRGGTTEFETPAGYTIESTALTLRTPTRSGHRFTGWVGTGLSAPALSVTIATGSTGHRAYAATWEQLRPATKASTTLRLTVLKKNARGVRLNRPKQVRITFARAAAQAAPKGTVRIVATGKLKNGKTVKRVRTIKVGLGQRVVPLPAGLKPGRWTVKASYAGDAGHKPSTSQRVKFRITK